MAERLTEKNSIENKRYVLNSEDNQIILTSAKLKNGFRKTYYYGKPIEKLAQFEDIMEKYGIESVEELDDLIANYRTSPILTEEMIKEIAVNEQRKVIQSMIKEITEKECNQLYTELNTWKRACELASETLKQVMGKPLWIGGNIPAPEVKDTEYFYQQAKKEGNDEK